MPETLARCQSWASAVSQERDRRRRVLSHRISLAEVNRGFALMHHQDGIRTVIGFN